MENKHLPWPVFWKLFRGRDILDVGNIDPIDVSGIKTVIFNTETRKSRIEDTHIMQIMKKGDIIARYFVKVVYPGDLMAGFSKIQAFVLGFKSRDAGNVYLNSNGNTVIMRTWSPRDFIAPEDSLYAAEMFLATVVTRIAQDVREPRQ